MPSLFARLRRETAASLWITLLTHSSHRKLCSQSLSLHKSLHPDAFTTVGKDIMSCFLGEKKRNVLTMGSEK